MHGLQDGDTVRFSEVKGLDGINGQEFKVKVVSSQVLQIDRDIKDMKPY
jgi:hypothetical protein